MTIRLFHVTNAESAESILATGFVDGTGSFGALDTTLTGVWVSAYRLDANEGAKGDTVLEILIESTPEQMFRDWEYIEEGKPYREWIIPAAVLNLGSVRRLTTEEELLLESIEPWNEYPPGEPEKSFAGLIELERLDGVNIE